MSILNNLKNLSKDDKQLIQDSEAILGPEPLEMGFIKNLFWGNFREDLVFPYPTISKQEEEKGNALYEAVDKYMREEHPSVYIDQKQEIPQWVISRLFELGVMGMTIPEEYGGLGLGITSYNRILARIGESCASTGVVVSAHQSIGCKAIMLFGTEEQKKKWLPKVATNVLSAFCLSEPNVGSDAGGQETVCELSKDGDYYVLNGEKKWTTSGSISGVFTVIAKQSFIDPETGKIKEGITAFICTPDMEGVDIFQKNRSKCGIRGTWQARIHFKNVMIPRENLLYKEGQGLKIALTCLNYGRCTLSATVMGAAYGSMEQANKWAQTRYQFQRSLSGFEAVQQRIARMAAYNFAIQATLYMVTGMLDRGDEDIMLETACIKVFSTEMAWRIIDDALQIMGGDGYMTENEVERSFRDSRIYRIVEGSNEVMQSFIFAYGGKKLIEHMLTLQQAVGWNSEQRFLYNGCRILKNFSNRSIRKKAIGLGSELFLGIKRSVPSITNLHQDLQAHSRKLAKASQEYSYQYKSVAKQHGEKLVKRQAIHNRLSNIVTSMFAITCVLSKLDHQLRNGGSGIIFERDKTAAIHFLDLAFLEIEENFRALKENADKSMYEAAEAALRYNDTLPNSEFYIHETSPLAKGTGKNPDQTWIKQFSVENTLEEN